MPLNCSESRRRLQRLLLDLWQELQGGELPNASMVPHQPAAGPSGSPKATATGDDAYLYILLIMIFYGCLAGGLILAYTRSRKLESKHDPYHLYIEHDWTERPEGGREQGATREPCLGEGTAGGPGERCNSGAGGTL